MEEYYFLFALAFIWTVFAVVVDFKKKEVPNWLNFSLIAFALAYRAFYSVSFNEWRFFIFGLIGFGIFFGLAHLFYYSRVFAGGDAKLLMGYGVILPYSDFNGLIYNGGIFLLYLFLFGAFYSLIFSIFIIRKNWHRFKKEFVKKANKSKWFFLFLVLLFLILSIFDFYFAILIFVFLSVFLFLYNYIKALEICMIKLVNAKDLQEGDWLEKDVKVRGKAIRKSVHGLSRQDIIILQRVGKNVLIKEGVPFTPAFLLALVFMGFFFLVLGVSPFEVFLF